MCSFCKSKFNCKRSRLTEHVKTALHKKNVTKEATKLTSLPIVTVIPGEENVKIDEMELEEGSCSIVQVRKICPTVWLCDSLYVALCVKCSHRKSFYHRWVNKGHISKQNVDCNPGCISATSNNEFWEEQMPKRLRLWVGQVINQP